MAGIYVTSISTMKNAAIKGTKSFMNLVIGVSAIFPATYIFAATGGVISPRANATHMMIPN